MDYLPEIKLFFWERLLTGQQKFESVQLTDFLFYQHPWFKDIVSSQDISRYVIPSEFHLNEPKVRNYLFELARMMPPCIRLSNMRISPDYFEAVKTSRYKRGGHYYALGMAAPSNTKMTKEQWAEIIKHDRLDLQPKYVAKIQNGDELTLDELEEIFSGGTSLLYGHFTFTLAVDHGALDNMINHYLENFVDGELDSDGVLYPTFGDYKGLFDAAINRLKPKHGIKNLPVQWRGSDGIWTRVGSESNKRFWELMFSLEWLKQIRIRNFDVKDDNYYMTVDILTSGEKQKNLITMKSYDRPVFEPDTGAIYWKGESIAIGNTAKQEYFICQYILNREVSLDLKTNVVDLSTAYAGKFGDEPKSATWAKDAVRRINDKFSEKFDFKILDHENEQVWVMKKNFDRE